MSASFSADWLRLREPFDAAARAAVAPDLEAWAARWRQPRAALSVIDLACGTGANLRELAPRLGGVQRWLLVDHDAALLQALAPALAEWAARRGHRFERRADGLRIEGEGDRGRAFAAELRCMRADLAHDLEALRFGEAQLVTASALLDLVSADWLQALLGRAIAARCALLFALNVDGRTVWDPADEGDALVQAAFAAHQQRDKGFKGGALGAEAAAEARRLLRGAGYRVACAASDWVVDRSQAGAPGGPALALQQAMIDGMAAAALEQAAGQAAAFGAWRRRRLALLGRSTLRVGHLDLMASQ